MAGDLFTGQLFISLLALLGGTFVREHMPSGAPSCTGCARTYADEEFHVDAVACVETAPARPARWANSKGGPSGVHPVRQPPLPVSFFRNEFLISNEDQPKTAAAARGPWLPSVKPSTILVLQVWLVPRTSRASGTTC